MLYARFVAATAIVGAISVYCSTATPDKIDCTGRPHCGLAGVERLILLDSLRQSLVDLPSLFGRPGIGIPADVLAEAYGIEDESRRFSLVGLAGATVLFPLQAPAPHYYRYRLQRVMISRLEAVLTKEKIRMNDPELVSPLIPMNIPGIGLNIYDPQQIRALVGTNLFRFPMRIEWKRADGVMVPYVQLDPDAALFARNCLDEAIRKEGKKPGCEDEVKNEQAKKVSFSAIHKGVSSMGLLASAASLDRSAWNLGFAPSSGSRNKQRSDHVACKGCPEILVPDNESEKIVIEPTQCKTYDDLKSAGLLKYAPNIEDADKKFACYFRMSLAIPAKAAQAYREIDVTAIPLKPESAHFTCGPADPPINVPVGTKVVSSPPPCENRHHAEWHVSGRLLTAGDQLERQQDFHLALWRWGSELPDKRTDELRNIFQIRIELDGKLNSPLARAWEALRAKLNLKSPPAPYWCSSSPCS